MEKIFYIEQKVKDRIVELNTECKEWKKKKNTLEKNIDKYIYDYITINELWNNYSAVISIMRCWPSNIYMPKTKERIQEAFNLSSKELREFYLILPNSDYQLDVTARRIFKKIRTRYCKLEKLIDESTEELKEYVISYIKHMGWETNVEALKAVRDILPAGYIRFLIIDWYQDLERKMKE